MGKPAELKPADSKNLGSIGSQLVIALETAYNAIRKDHPDVPPAVIVINSGGNVKYGHFAYTKWDVGGQKLPELMISAEGLQRPASMVLATLVHEAAHGLAYTRKIKDVSNNGKYHNKKFAELATELGLDASTYDGPGKSLGHSNTTLPDGAWSGVLTKLEPKLVAFRDFDPPRKPTGIVKARELSLKCRCPRTIRAFAGVVDKGPIECGVCGDEFQ